VKTLPDSQLGFANSENFEEKEVFLYGLTSFVSEFGGALGLFLGFSFFSCWDVLNIFLTACHQGKAYTSKTGKTFILATLFKIQSISFSSNINALLFSRKKNRGTKRRVWIAIS
jgi:hypothetical protein